MNWLDKDFPSKEGREATCEEDGSTRYKVSRRAIHIAQRRDIGSCKGKAPRIISLCSNINDGDNRGDRNIGGEGGRGDVDSEDASGTME